jgi:hypothetical protein
VRRAVDKPDFTATLNPFYCPHCPCFASRD